MRVLIALALCSAAGAQFAPPSFAQFRFRCSTALNCTASEFCDKDGVISSTPINLSESQLILAVPRLPCRRPDGSDGVCCRDRDYKDDWPTDYVDPGIPRPPPTQNKEEAASRPKPPPSVVREDELAARTYLPPTTRAPTTPRTTPRPPPPPPVRRDDAVTAQTYLPPTTARPTTRSPPTTTRAPTTRAPTTRPPPPPPVRRDDAVTAQTYLPPTTRASTTRAPTTRPPPPTPAKRDDAIPTEPSRQYLPGKGDPLPAGARRSSFPIGNSFFERGVAASGQPVTKSVDPQLAAPQSPSLPPSFPTPLVTVPAPKVTPAPAIANGLETNTKRIISQTKVDAMIDALKAVLLQAEPSEPRVRTIVVETIQRPKRPTTLLAGCPRRNRTALPDVNTKNDENDFDAGAGEFPWQAAVLSLNGELLCGCYFTEEDTCVTAASCIANHSHSDLQVAVGVYDHTSPLSVTELASPKPAQILKIHAIERTDSTAILFFSRTVQLNHYTLPICVDRPQGIPFYDFNDCVVTGWGPDSSTVHYFDVELLSRDECNRLVPGSKSQSCARAKNSAACDHIEAGAGLQCRYLGDRASRKNDIYWLKGVFQRCLGDERILIYDHLDIDWFEASLVTHRQN